MVGSLSYVIELQRGPVVQYSIDAGGPLPTLVKANHRGVCGANYPAQKIISYSERTMLWPAAHRWCMSTEKEFDVEIVDPLYTTAW